MTSAVWKLIAAIALAWMPIGMSPASAAALSAAAPAAMTDHCAGGDSAPHGKAMHSADCTGCVAVAELPARASEPTDARALPAFSPRVPLRTGLHAETSTPPPKAA